MLAQSSSSLLNLLQTLDQDALAAFCILGIIGSFVTVIIAIVTVTSTIKNISMTKMNQAMTKDLLEKGYSIDDVERLVHFGGWGGKHHQAGRQPMPPLKQPA